MGLGARYQVIVTTNYDDVLEQAFHDQKEPFDLLIYEAADGSFWHRSSDGAIDRAVTSPTDYSALAGVRTVIVKIHGTVKRNEESGTHDSYVISENDYIDYMVYEDVLNRFPPGVKEKLTECSFLFLGYALRDWNLRVLLRRISRNQKLHQESWAVVRGIGSIERLFWEKQGTKIVHADLAEFSGALAGAVERMPPGGNRSMSHPESPFKGLMPFEERDWPYFFGRDSDQSIIASNLKGSRLTLLYGPSGVGKSSVLRAGVRRAIDETIRFNREDIGAPGYAFAYAYQWREDPVAVIRQAIAVALDAAKVSVPAKLFQSCGLMTALESGAGALGGTLLIVLDQFEEYFLYHPDEDGEGNFRGGVSRRDSTAATCT